MTEIKCDTCRHNRTTVEDIIVDNRVADEYEEWGCAREDDLTEDELNVVFAGGECPFYEYDKNLDDPCYGCPGAPDYCDKCNGREKE